MTQAAPPITEHRAPKIASSKTMVDDERNQLSERRKALGLPDGTAWFGMACSGGGIRSATFNLGILQALAQKGLLPYVDYLSTVSGGGYIGTWLHGVIRNLGEGKPAKAASFLAPPELRPHDERNPDKDPIAFLRKYSSYLAASIGLFSADFWVILVIWFRNILLNQLILVPFLGSISFAAVYFGSASHTSDAAAALRAGGIFGGIALFCATVIAAWGVGAVIAGKRSALDSTKGAVSCASALLVSSVCVAFLHGVIFQPDNLRQSLETVFAALFFLFVILQLIGRFFTCSKSLHPQRNSFTILSMILLHCGISASATAGLIFLALKWLSAWNVSAQGPWRVVAWGPPVVAMAWMTGESIHIGLMGVNYEDFAREWLARVGAFINILALAWTLLFTLAVFGPYWIMLLVLWSAKTAAGLGGAWFLTTFSGVLSGKSDQTSGAATNASQNGGATTPSPAQVALEWIAKAAPIVFVTGFLVLISFAGFAALRAVVLRLNPTTGTASSVAGIPEWLQWVASMKNDYWAVLNSQDAWWIILSALGVCAFVAWGMQYCININEFSMHHFYKNRLVRCYLGASRDGARKPSRLTGFDRNDDFPIGNLRAAFPPPTPGEDAPKPYLGPYAIVNGTVNLNRGSELARQERQGESFIFTPLYCGFDPAHSAEDHHVTANSKTELNEYGYRETLGYTSPVGPRIGTCMGISGAAANPNHGYHTSTTVAFLMTVFDVRLGWWLGNPRRKSNSGEPGPTQSLWPLLSELFSQTDERAHWLNLSDGGHFENLGVYELVRRRCKYIIVGDGEQDGDYTFGSLGGAVRKCRTDFGVDIDIDPGRIHPAKDKPSSTHCVVGTIHYPSVDGAPASEGKLLYLKSSLTGDEPEDVRQYAASNRDFPHQTTANQFFTESQFESYRKLGWHVAQTAFQNVNTGDPNAPKRIDDIFRCLDQQWYPPSPEGEGVASRHAEAYTALMKRLNERALAELGPQLFDWGGPAEPRKVPYNFSRDDDRTIFLYGLELIQLMENVWSDLHLDRYAEREGPRHRGWMGIFSRWAQQTAIQWTWNNSKTAFNPLFQQFFETLADSSERYKVPAPGCGSLPLPKREL